MFYGEFLLNYHDSIWYDVRSGASRAQRALLRSAPVNRRYAERQKQRALAIQRLGNEEP